MKKLQYEIYIIPHCDHREFVATCIWCADANLREREARETILNLAYKTLLPSVKTKILVGEIRDK